MRLLFTLKRLLVAGICTMGFVLTLFVQLKAQNAVECSDFLGDVQKTDQMQFTGSGHIYYYPREIPDNTPDVSNSEGGAFIADLYFNAASTIPVGDPVIKTIIPTLNGSVIEDVLVRIISLDLEDDAEIKIYRGIDASGIPEVTINNSNQWILGVDEYIFQNTPVTITFTGTGSGSNLSLNHFRVFTGDVSFESCRNQTVFLWEESIIPDSYISLDDFGGGLPTCMAYFDGAKNLVSKDVSFCLNIWADEPHLSYGYQPGEVTFSVRVPSLAELSNPLVEAQILWLINQANSASLQDIGNIQYAIWAIQGYAGTENQWSADARTAVPSLPSPPEPEPFTLTATGETAVLPTQSIDLKIEFATPIDPLDASETLKLVFPNTVTVTVVSGGNLVGDVLTPNAAETILRLTSSTATKFTFQAVYDDPRFYNVKNLNIFEPCNDNVQPFLHVGSKNLVRPFRSIEVEWDSSLPVSLLSFEAKAENNTTQLNWSVADEANFSHFEVQKSADSQNWRQLAKVTGNNGGKYSAVDAHLQNSNTVYYRLKMVDLDGSFEYSRIESVSLRGKETLLYAYPNPVTNRLFLKNFADDTEITLYNQTGQVMVSGRATADGIDVRNQKPGMYLAVIRQASGEQVIQKILIN